MSIYVRWRSERLWRRPDVGAVHVSVDHALADGATFDLAYAEAGRDQAGPTLVLLPGGPGLASVAPYPLVRRRLAGHGFHVVMPERVSASPGSALTGTHELVYGERYAKTATAGYSELRPAHFALLRFPGLDGARPTELAASLATSKQAINPLLNDPGTVRISRAPRRDPGNQIEHQSAEQLGERHLQAVLAALDEIARQHPAHPDYAGGNG